MLSTLLSLCSCTIRYWNQTLVVMTPGGDLLVVIPLNPSWRSFSLWNRSRERMWPLVFGDSKRRMLEEAAVVADSSRQLKSNSNVIRNSGPSLGRVLMRLSFLIRITFSAPANVKERIHEWLRNLQSQFFTSKGKRCYQNNYKNTHLAFLIKVRFKYNHPFFHFNIYMVTAVISCVWWLDYIIWKQSLTGKSPTSNK